MPRIATCSCGQLKLTMQGDPTDVTVCHCFECQKSTGSVFGVSTYWPKSACRSIEGEAKLWRRSSDAGRWLDNYFCPVCGSTVYWYAEFAPDEIGVSAGNFADPGFPAPTSAVWDSCRHPWVKLPAGLAAARQAAWVACVTRVAVCSCGQLSVTLSGEPREVTVCHCLQCQKSTGSVFGVYAFWPSSACRVHGRRSQLLAPLLGFRALGRELFLPDLRKHGLLAHGTGRRTKSASASAVSPTRAFPHRRRRSGIPAGIRGSHCRPPGRGTPADATPAADPPQFSPS